MSGNLSWGVWSTCCYNASICLHVWYMCIVPLLRSMMQDEINLTNYYIISFYAWKLLMVSDNYRGKKVLSIRSGTFSWEEEPNTMQSVNSIESRDDNQDEESKGALLLKNINLQVEKVTVHRLIYWIMKINKLNNVFSFKRKWSKLHYIESRDCIQTDKSLL